MVESSRTRRALSSNCDLMTVSNFVSFGSQICDLGAPPGLMDLSAQARRDVEMGSTAPVVTGAEFLIRLAGGGNLQRFEEEIDSLLRYPRLDVRAGRDVYYDRTPLHLAAMHRQVEIVRCILRRLLPNPGNTVQLRDHVEYAQDVVNARDRFGYTPLHLAIRGRLAHEEAEEEEDDYARREEQREEVVRLLTTSSWVLPDRFIAATGSIDDHYLYCDGFTPLHMAARRGNIPIVKLLLRQSLCRGEYSDCEPVNVRATTWEGDSVFDLAKSHSDLVELLECFDLTALQSEREKNANSMNAVLVGATLVMAATFATWLQPPLGIPDPFPDPVTGNFSRQSRKLAWFFLLVEIAFGFSTVALVTGIVAVIPWPGASLKSEVEHMRKSLRGATYSLLLAIGCLNFAFYCAGLLVFERVSVTRTHNYASKMMKYLITDTPFAVFTLMIFAIIGSNMNIRKDI